MFYDEVKGQKDLQGSMSEDYYNIIYSEADVEIMGDNGGNDRILLDGVYAKKGHSLNFFFDVAKQEGMEFQPNLIILKDDKIREYVMTQQSETGVVNGSICIQNWLNTNTDIDSFFSDGFIENITVAHGTDGVITDMENYFKRVTKEVREWLNNPNHTYNNTMEALMYCQDNNAIKELIGIYTKELCPIELVYSEEAEGGYTGVNRNEFFTGAGNEVVYSYDDTKIYAGAGNDKLYRGDDATNYALFGEVGNDILEAGMGATLNGGIGDNVIIVDGDCNTIIQNGKGCDYINFVNANSFDDLSFAKQGQNLVIQVANQNERIVLQDYFKLYAKFSVKGFSFGDIGNIKDMSADNYLYAEDILRIVKNKSMAFVIGSNEADSIKGTNLDEYILGQGGNDKLAGQGGNNTFVFDNNSGHDTITMGKGVDTIRFEDIDYSDGSLKYTNNKKDLVIKYNNGESSVSVKNYLANPGKASVKEIEFVENGTIVDSIVLSGNLNLEIDGIAGKKNNLKGSVLDDVINGKNLSDTIKGGDGNDKIYGCESNDKLSGDAGVNGFFFKAGDGVDTITMGKGRDILVFDTSLEGTLEFVQNKKNLEIHYGTGDDKVIIANYFSSKIPSVDKIVFADYYDTSIDLENVSADISLNNILVKGQAGYIKYSSSNGIKVVKGLIYEGGSQDNVIFGDSSKSSLIESGYGNDIIYCNSKLTGAYGGYEKGSGFDGNDEYIVKNLKNGTKIADGGGDDTLVIDENRFNAKGQENKMYFIFDVVREGGSGNTSFDDMFILNEKTMKSLTKSKNLSKVTTGIQVSDVFGEGSIETIETKDGYYVDAATLDAVRSNVATWLAENTDCNTAYQALQDPTVDISGLLAAYNVNWQQG